MGLDWEPLPTPKRGYEAEFVQLFGKLASAEGAKRAQVMGWFQNVSEPPFATIGAPRVGYDPDADAWLVDRLAQSGRSAELDSLRVELRGHPVLELLPPCDGFPVYSNHTVDDRLDRYSFAAEQLVELRPVLGDGLWRRAYQMQLPEAHGELAALLADVADRFARENALPVHVATVREPVFAKGTVARQGHVLYAAAKWSAYWAARGHGLAVSY